MIPKPPYDSVKKDYCIFEVQRKNDIDSSYVTACYPKDVEMTSKLLEYITSRSKNAERVICYRFQEEWDMKETNNEKINHRGVAADDVLSLRMSRI